MTYKMVGLTQNVNKPTKKSWMGRWMDVQAVIWIGNGIQQNPDLGNKGSSTEQSSFEG